MRWRLQGNPVMHGAYVIAALLETSPFLFDPRIFSTGKPTD